MEVLGSVILTVFLVTVIVGVLMFINQDEAEMTAIRETQRDKEKYHKLCNSLKDIEDEVHDIFTTYYSSSKTIEKLLDRTYKVLDRSMEGMEKSMGYGDYLYRRFSENNTIILNYSHRLWNDLQKYPKTSRYY